MSWRGYYYKNKYGRRGKGRRENEETDNTFSQTFRNNQNSNLYNTLSGLNGLQYPAYRDIVGLWEVEEFQIYIDKVQVDPFAKPSHIRARLDMKKADFPEELYCSKIRNIAICDFITRKFFSEIKNEEVLYSNKQENYYSSKGNEIFIEKPSQNILQRSSLIINNNFIECRCTANLPAKGRRIEGRKAANLLCVNFINILRKCLYFSSLDFSLLNNHIQSVEDQQYLRDNLETYGLVGFVINGACLPRISGIDDKPMHLNNKNVIKFSSPKSLEISIIVPNRGKVVGMGIKKGITLIVGGGFNGKTTLLEALQFGLYNKIPGDGREFVIVHESAVKIRAEDGRSVTSVDISPFIRTLPYNKSTCNFSSLDASGSTSQSANIIENVELSTKLLLIDEDTCATNFMIRDIRMQQLVANEKEPITAFIYKIRPLYKYGVSTILIVGSCGDFFDVADTVIHMDEYIAYDVTQKAKQIANQFNQTYNLLNKHEEYEKLEFGRICQRVIASDTFPEVINKEKSFGVKSISLNKNEIDLSYIEQIVEPSQTRAIADILVKINKDKIINNHKTLKEIMMQVKVMLEGNPHQKYEIGQNGLDNIKSYNHPIGFHSLPRIYEIAAAINRWRNLKVVEIKY